jgi:hypothetical protein
MATGDAAAASALHRLAEPWSGHVAVVGTGAAVLGPVDLTLSRLAAVGGDVEGARRSGRAALLQARASGADVIVGECAATLARWEERTEAVRLADEAARIGAQVGSRRLLRLASRHGEGS